MNVVKELRPELENVTILQQIIVGHPVLEKALKLGLVNILVQVNTFTSISQVLQKIILILTKQFNRVSKNIIDRDSRTSYNVKKVTRKQQNVKNRLDNSATRRASRIRFGEYSFRNKDEQ